MLATPMGAMLRPLVDRQVQSMNQFYAQDGHRAVAADPPPTAPPSTTATTTTTALGQTLVLFDKLNQADRVVAKFKEFVYTSFVALSDDERQVRCDALR